MKKNKEWAQKEVDRYLSYEGVNEARNALVFAKGVIDQLDEPEVLSQEWIDEYAQGDYDEWVYTEDLENFLVPKHELPVIPKYVADFIEARKYTDAYSFQYIFCTAMERSESEKLKKEYDWIRENDETFARAWLDGFTVEEEPKYYVSARDEEYGGFWFLSKNNNGDISIGVNRDWSEVDWDRLKLTEQEIKDYDPRYWAFAVPVEELENER